ncbi:oocyte zinc finger protein XlCOF7.2-like isoform X1 [Diabrotica virgifera virgifera]|uniref:C2H2-type domain-containing protein n=3 Tax=Diabrotica virgifera virgifera TaxID=50390 RepID=A0ABM5JPY2_DIAVI|nr:oocyte zinc finger protein XlCOF7.2-like isoform X1 [Diabrotica virgifera virgifera]XP_050499987.1 oocyte zinc finger protein XlCOF7.2-like isoform X1 [Diabrotica virgifera virgifera]
MNFTPFGVPLTAALPVATQFTAGKITQNVTTPNGQVVGVLQGGENGVHYIRPLDTNAFATAASQQNQGTQIITLPITMPGAKPGDPQQTVQIQVVNPQPTPVSQASPASSPKYQISQIPMFSQGATVLTVAYNSNQEGIQILDGQNGVPEGMTVVAALQPQDIQLIQTHATELEKNDKELQPPVALIKSELKDTDETAASISVPTQYLQTTNLHEYIQKMQNTTLPLSLQQFLKFNTTDIKREIISEDGLIEAVSIAAPDGNGHLIMQDVGEMETEENPDDSNDKGKKKKKYKKKPPKPKKPKPGQVHIATALDGTTLFCCPECHMAYPQKELLEQHLVGHKIERRFICDICGAGLKRKEHLERHKLGHNPERPFVCSVCMKGFKRKEHLNLHFVIHSGEKTEICGECGKGFYRKDHLRKHARSHITRRIKEQAEQAERTQGLLKDPITSSTSTAQVTISVGGVPNSQIQIPVHIQVPQHLQVSTSNDEDNENVVSTVVLPSAADGLSILPN